MVLQMATAFVESGNVPASEILLVPAEAEFCGLELRFLKSIAKEQLVRIESPLEFVADDDGEGPDLSFFRSIGEANHTPAAAGVFAAAVQRRHVQKRY